MGPGRSQIGIRNLCGVSPLLLIPSGSMAMPASHLLRHARVPITWVSMCQAIKQAMIQANFTGR